MFSQKETAIQSRPWKAWLERWNQRQKLTNPREAGNRTGSFDTEMNPGKYKSLEGSIC